MNKTQLTKFIEKYNLAGSIESVIWNCKSGVSRANFSHEDKTLIGSVTCKKMDLPDGQLGIYTTSELSKIINIMKDDIKLQLDSRDDKPVALNLSDAVYKSKYHLSEIDVIPKAGKMTAVPDFELVIDMDDKFIEQFLSAKGALPEASVFAISCTDNEVEFIMNYSNINTNNITFHGNGKSAINFKPTLFSAEKIRSILVANKTSTKKQLRISTKGLAEFSFSEGDFDSIYFLVQMQLI
jgi:hypothetical protein